MNWLSALPHQIPFRAASTGRRVDHRTVEGTFLCTANDELSPEVMLIEAMAQLAGSLVFGERRGLLTGVDDCALDRAISAGDVVALTVRLEASFEATHRFAGTASIDGLQCAHGRFYLTDEIT